MDTDGEELGQADSPDVEDDAALPSLDQVGEALADDPGAGPFEITRGGDDGLAVAFHDGQVDPGPGRRAGGRPHRARVDSRARAVGGPDPAGGPKPKVSHHPLTHRPLWTLPGSGQG